MVRAYIWIETTTLPPPPPFFMCRNNHHQDRGHQRKEEELIKPDFFNGTSYCLHDQLYSFKTWDVTLFTKHNLTTHTHKVNQNVTHPSLFEMDAVKSYFHFQHSSAQVFLLFRFTTKGCKYYIHTCSFIQVITSSFAKNNEPIKSASLIDFSISGKSRSKLFLNTSHISISTSHAHGPVPAWIWRLKLLVNILNTKLGLVCFV